MKRIFALFTLCVLLAGCKDDSSETPSGGLSIDDSMLTITLDSGESSKRVRFTAYQSWTATTSSPTSADRWYLVSPAKGEAGDVSVNISVETNDTGADRTLTILLKAGSDEKTINVLQPAQEMFSLESTSFFTGLEGGEIAIQVKSNIDFNAVVNKDAQSWIEQIEPNAKATAETTTLRFRVLKGETDRKGIITFITAKSTKEVIITQAYESTDFSADGKVVTLQTATEGSGIPIIIMGDAYTDRDIASGVYMETMNKAMNTFFDHEPYTTFRNLFSVYAVNVVSKNGSYFDGAQTSLKGKFTPNSTLVSGDDSKCRSYAYKIPIMNTTLMERTLIIVMMNQKSYAGTCYMYPPNNPGDYGNGTAIAYFPLGTDEEMFSILLTHEAGGHGFAKLGDEYSYPTNGRIPQNEIDDLTSLMKNGWYKNNDFTNDPQTIKWSKFIADERYAKEKIGVYEGADTYTKGIYRPSDKGIMNDNTGTFNAPSREAIYFRINKLAYGTQWIYNYEDFVKYDEINRNKPAEVKRSIPHRDLMPLARPVIVYE